MSYFWIATHDRGPVNGGDTPLAAMIATMSPGEWREATGIYRPIDMDIGLSDPAPNQNGVVPYTGEQSYDPILGQIWGRGMDHGSYIGGGMWALNLATNAFLGAPKQQILNGSVFPTSHGYCHSTTNPANGKRYVLATGQSALYEIDPVTAVLTQVASVSGATQLIASAFTWWPGRGGVWYNCNDQTLNLWNGSSWSVLKSNAIPGAVGGYACVLCYSALHNCMVYGGSTTSQQLYRLNSDNTTALLNTPSWPIGPSLGARVLTSDGAGEFLVIGYNEVWQLNLSGGPPVAKTSYPVYPPGMLEPKDLHTTMVGCTALGALLVFDRYNPNNPQSRLWIRKAG